MQISINAGMEKSMIGGCKPKTSLRWLNFTVTTSVAVYSRSRLTLECITRHSQTCGTGLGATSTPTQQHSIGSPRIGPPTLNGRARSRARRNPRRRRRDGAHPTSAIRPHLHPPRRLQSGNRSSAISCGPGRSRGGEMAWAACRTASRYPMPFTLATMDAWRNAVAARSARNRA